MNLYFTALFKFVLSIYFLETLRVCVWRFQLRCTDGIRELRGAEGCAGQSRTCVKRTLGSDISRAVSKKCIAIAVRPLYPAQGATSAHAVVIAISSQ